MGVVLDVDGVRPLYFVMLALLSDLVMMMSLQWPSLLILMRLVLLLPVPLFDLGSPAAATAAAVVAGLMALLLQ